MSEIRDFNLNVLGLDIAFRAGADAERVENAKAMVEERFNKLRSHGGKASKELLLTCMVLGLADDLLQSQKEVVDIKQNINSLLIKIKDLS